MAGDIPASPADLPTPYLAVDVDRLTANARSMSAHARAVGASLRPHVKTHKSVQIARIQQQEGAVGLTVATLDEATVFARAGFDDLFVAYPVWLDPATADQFSDLLDNCQLRVGCDSLDAARRLAEFRGQGEFGIVIEVDSGHHRSGLEPERAGPLAAAMIDLGLDVHGVFTFPGHSYSPQVTDVAADDEAEALATAARSLSEAGVPCGIRSGGSTPSARAVRPGALTELRPGVYVLNDAQQWELGTAGPDQLALTAVGTVVSHAGGRLVLDTGSKCLGGDRPSWTTGFGRLLDHPTARIEMLSEHHAVAHLEGRLPAIGTRVRVVPNHVCVAVHLARELVVLQGDSVVDLWPVDA